MPERTTWAERQDRARKLLARSVDLEGDITRDYNHFSEEEHIWSGQESGVTRTLGRLAAFTGRLRQYDRRLYEVAFSEDEEGWQRLRPDSRVQRAVVLWKILTGRLAP